jgi:putative transposase
MAHSFISLHLHFVFSTKERLLLLPENPFRLYQYLGGIAKHHSMKLLSAGGMRDHIHLLVSLPSDLSVARAVNLLKSNSSAWLREKDRQFGWQQGYAGFGVSMSGLGAVSAYIENQAAHHRTRDFRQEYLALLKKHQIAYDPRWVFD